MMSQRIISSQNKEWSGDPLIQPRDYPKVYVDSAGPTDVKAKIIQEEADKKLKQQI